MEQKKKKGSQSGQKQREKIGKSHLLCRCSTYIWIIISGTLVMGVVYLTLFRGRSLNTKVDDLGAQRGPTHVYNASYIDIPDCYVSNFP